MGRNVTNFFETIPSLREKIEGQSNKVKKIQVCILYAIEEENVVVFDRIREFAKDACNELGLFIKTKDPEHAFLSEWGKAVQGLKDEKRISEIHIHELGSTRSLVPGETSRLLKYLVQIEKPSMVYSGLKCLWRVSRYYDISSDQKLLNALLMILKNDSLIDNNEIVFELMRVLSEMFSFNQRTKPPNHEQRIEYLCTNHVKQICMTVRKKKDLELIRKASIHLFVYTPCEIVISTIFELIENLTDEEYRSVQSDIHYSLLNSDSVLFKELNGAIDEEIKHLLQNSRKEIQKRAHDLNVSLTEKSLHRDAS